MYGYYVFQRDLFACEDLLGFLANIISWYRYIDDVLIFLSGTEVELGQFLQAISINDFNLKFTMSCSQMKICFLDVKISLDYDGIINSSLYSKLSAGNTILHDTSSHLEPLLKHIPYSQNL